MKTRVPSWCKPWPYSWCWYVVTSHTRRICCHGSWLQFHPGLLHFNTEEQNISQWLLQIYVLGCVCGSCLHPLQFVVWWSVLKEPGLRGLAEVREQWKGCRWGSECWQLSEFQWSVLAGTSEQLWIFLFEKLKTNLFHSCTAKENVYIWNKGWAGGRKGLL